MFIRTQANEERRRVIINVAHVQAFDENEGFDLTAKMADGTEIDIFDIGAPGDNPDQQAEISSRVIIEILNQIALETPWIDVEQIFEAERGAVEIKAEEQVSS